MKEENTDLSFLPYLLDDEIYLIDNEIGVELAPKEGKIELPLAQKAESLVQENITSTTKPAVEPIKLPALPELKTPPKPVSPSANTVMPPSPQRTFKKVVILVGYKGETPAGIMEAISKIFTALQVSLRDIEIINVLNPESKKTDDFTFSYLILMGGNGKNLDFLASYAGTRTQYDIITHRGTKVFFSEAMDVYMKPENIELKKKFWAKLKQMFS